jgi:hypothetical protein
VRYYLMLRRREPFGAKQEKPGDTAAFKGKPQREWGIWFLRQELKISVTGLLW